MMVMLVWRLPMLILRIPLKRIRPCGWWRWWWGYHTGIEACATKAVCCCILSRRCSIEYHLAVVETVIILDRIPFGFVEPIIGGAIPVINSMTRIVSELNGILRVSRMSRGRAVAEMCKGRIVV